MMNSRILGALLLALGLQAGSAAAVPLLSLAPATQMPGPDGVVQLAVNISGLRSDNPNQLLGAFDLSIYYDTSQLVFQNPPSTLGNALGDLGSGFAIGGFDLSTPNMLRLFEVSFLENGPADCSLCSGPYLADLQADSFALAMLTFTLSRTATTASTTLLRIDQALLADGSGVLLPVAVGEAAAVTVAEPGTLLLMGVALLGWGICAGRTMHQDVLEIEEGQS